MSENAIKIRQRILQLVEQFPGLHLRDLARRANLSEALAGYHLQALEKERFVQSRFDDFYRRFYPVQASAPTGADLALLGILRQRVPAEIALHLLETSPSTQVALTKKLGLSKSTLSYHMSRLQASGLILAGPDGVRLRDPERVRRILLTWRPPSDVTERFADMWRKLYRSAR